MATFTNLDPEVNCEFEELPQVSCHLFTCDWPQQNVTALAEKEAEFRIVQSGRHDESLSDEQRREHRMNYDESYLSYREAQVVRKEAQTAISDELNDALSDADAADSVADELANKGIDTL